MKESKTVCLLFVTAICLTFCAMKQEFQTAFPQEIKSVYFQNWVGGQEGSGSGTIFYIEFKKPILPTIQLNKIYFNNQEASLEKQTANTFAAHFYYRKSSSDIIMDIDPAKEYGNKPPVIQKTKFDLKPNEAVLEYKNKNKTQFFKIINPKEKPMIAYPSMNKPKD